MTGMFRVSSRHNISFVTQAAGDGKQRNICFWRQMSRVRRDCWKGYSKFHEAVSSQTVRRRRVG
jgi:hypothetical protein